MSKFRFLSQPSLPHLSIIIIVFLAIVLPFAVYEGLQAQRGTLFAESVSNQPEVGGNSELSGTPSQQEHATMPNCLPRPACLDSKPRCEIAEPIGGWCNPSVTFPPHPSEPVMTVEPSLTPPPGCKLMHQMCPMNCRMENGQAVCPPCKPLIVCPSLSPIRDFTPTPVSGNLTPVPTEVCLPRPSCLDATPKCDLPEPVGGWCKGTQGLVHMIGNNDTQGQGISSVIVFLNSFLRQLLGLNK